MCLVSQKDSILSWVLRACLVLGLLFVDVTGAKRTCKRIKNVSIINSNSGPYFKYNANHEIYPSGVLPYDPMGKLLKKIHGECKKACQKDKSTCGAWRTVTSGNSAGTYATCELYKKGTYTLVYDTNGLPACGRAGCIVGACS